MGEGVDHVRMYLTNINSWWTALGVVLIDSILRGAALDRRKVILFVLLRRVH